MTARLAMAENTPEDAFADLERASRLDERQEDLLQAVKDTLSLFGQPKLALLSGSTVFLAVPARRMREVMSNNMALIDFVETTTETGVRS